MPRRDYYVYIMASKSGTLYIGVTNNLVRRVFEHKNGLIEGFTKRYACHKLVYCEHTHDVNEAIRREKSLKGITRAKKELLIRSMNPGWLDLCSDFFPPIVRDPSLRSG